MAVVDVRLDGFGGYVTNTAKEFARTPKMAFTEMPAQPRMLAEKPVGAASFKQLKRSGDAQGRGQTNKQVDVVCFNLELEDLHIMRFRNLLQKLLTVFADDRKLKRVPCVFRFPHEVERGLADSVAVVDKSFHHFIFSSARFFAKLTLHCLVWVECASFAAHSILYQESRKSMGGRNTGRILI